MIDSHQKSALFIELGDCCGHPQRFFKIKVKDTITARMEELDI